MDAEATLRCEFAVAYDHFSQGRFRNGTQFVRWRPDKAPEQCRMEQVLLRRSRAEVPSL